MFLGGLLVVFQFGAAVRTEKRTFGILRAADGAGGFFAQQVNFQRILPPVPREWCRLSPRRTPDDPVPRISWKCRR